MLTPRHQLNISQPWELRLLNALLLFQKEDWSFDLIRRVFLDHPLTQFEQTLPKIFFGIKNRRVSHSQFPGRLWSVDSGFLSEAFSESCQAFFSQMSGQRHG